MSTFEVIGFHTWHLREIGQLKTLCGRDTFNMEVHDAEIPDEVECKRCLKVYPQLPMAEDNEEGKLEC